ncbi:hypothetical protein ZHAS_00019728 [Anopheles sinensis]|uniref:Uncharacterized protein n=1 Tax=Anopheles sinensis TaxID=74873 RepID=A0A084WN55_ANOSI|nr:hypothetical protein ZHAS_00019728 [Anopheles sinensis]
MASKPLKLGHISKSVGKQAIVCRVQSKVSKSIVHSRKAKQTASLQQAAVKREPGLVPVSSVEIDLPLENSEPHPARAGFRRANRSKSRFTRSNRTCAIVFDYGMGRL